MADGKSFSTPKRRLTIEKGSFQDKKERHKRYIEYHNFNHSVQLVIPDCSFDSALQCFQGVTPTQDHFCLTEIPVYALTEVEFIKTFIKNGQFIALSWETHIDSSNCAAVLPTGVLILSLDKDTYELLGLTGKASVFQKKHRFMCCRTFPVMGGDDQRLQLYLQNKFPVVICQLKGCLVTLSSCAVNFVEVDLTSPYFVPGKKQYDRVRWCLKDKQLLTFKFLMSWTCEGHVSTDKLYSYFSSYNVQKLGNVEDIQSEPKHKKVPIISYTRSQFIEEKSTSENCDVCSCMSFFEWLGCVACGIDCSEAASDSFVSTLSCPEPSQDLTQMMTCRWTGLITTSSVLSLVNAARDVVKSSNLPWMTVTVWGFTDCPVTWKKNEHGHFLSGENFYTFVIFPGDTFWLYKINFGLLEVGEQKKANLTIFNPALYVYSKAVDLLLNCVMTGA